MNLLKALVALAIFLVCIPLVGYALVLSAIPGQFPYALMMTSGIGAVLTVSALLIRSIEPPKGEGAMG